MAHDYAIREAVPADLDVLVAFTVQEARESDGSEKDVRGVTRGVQAAFDDPPLARYWVAETGARRVVANISVVTEWSNFHGGCYWWIQSLFIDPEHRGAGLVQRLLDHVARAAAEAGALDLRLHARESNERALRVYRRAGFTVAPYIMLRRSLGE